MGRRSTCPQRSSDHCAFGDFFSRRARSFSGFGVHFDAVDALRGERHAQRDEFTIFSRNGSVLAADDLVEIQPSSKLRRRKFPHFFQEPQIGWIMVVIAHFFSFWIFLEGSLRKRISTTGGRDNLPRLFSHCRFVSPPLGASESGALFSTSTQP